MGAIDRYQDNLSNPPRTGEGVHSWVMSSATLGIMAGLPPEQIHADLWQTIPQDRKNPDREIYDALTKALSTYRPDVKLSDDSTYRRYTPLKTTPIIRNGEAVQKKIIAEGEARCPDEVDLWDLSPLRLWHEPQYDAPFFLQAMFEKQDLLWLGERYDKGVIGINILPVSEWLHRFRKNGKLPPPFLIQNPFSGKEGLTHDGKPSFRCDNTIVAFKYAICEHDTLSRNEQISLWSGIKLPVKAIVDTGGKSLHAWLDCSKLAKIATIEDWRREIKSKLYEQGLQPLGFDPSCTNPSRLTRMPGHFRAETGRYQRILWIAPEGRCI